MKGICFKEPLFHATVEGRKTQTRRIVKPQPFNPRDTLLYHLFNEKNKRIKPKYKVGEKVYLKEPYFLFTDDCENKPVYKYDKKWECEKWENKLFMPERYGRYFIEITAVRCERLQDISDKDCIAEGIFCFGDKYVYDHPNGDSRMIKNNPREAYAALIDKINGKGTWESNPYVWVYDYKLTK